MRDRKNILARDRLLDRGDRRIEALDMADHQRDAGAARGGDDVAPLLDRGGDRLLDQDVDVARDAGERDLVMQMGRRRDRHGIDALGEQLVELGEGAAADQLGGARAMFRQRIDDADQRDAGQTGQHAGMVAAHHAGADHADAQAARRLGLRVRSGPFGTHIVDPKQTLQCAGNVPGGSLARRHKCGECRSTVSGHVLIQKLHADRGAVKLPVSTQLRW